MKKISYLQLQKKYPKKIVALDKKEKNVLAVGKRFTEIFKKLKNNHLNIKNAVFVGPVQRKGTVNVYLSLRKKTYR